jgi:hypothetical protein
MWEVSAMKEEYKPSVDFVSNVMKQVYSCETSKASFFEWLINQPSIRYALVGSGALLGILKTVPAF